ncbi:MAG: hypothetical protein NVSMB9_02620 [Isosphaeraceae bacterium]
MTWTRPWKLASRALIVSCALGMSHAPTSSFAQAPEEAPPPAPGEGSGRPVDGYIATGMMAALILFIVAKSARR